MVRIPNSGVGRKERQQQVADVKAWIKKRRLTKHFSAPYSTPFSTPFKFGEGVFQVVTAATMRCEATGRILSTAEEWRCELPGERFKALLDQREIALHASRHAIEAGDRAVVNCYVSLEIHESLAKRLTLAERPYSNTWKGSDMPLLGHALALFVETQMAVLALLGDATPKVMFGEAGVKASADKRRRVVPLRSATLDWSSMHSRHLNYAAIGVHRCGG